MRLVLRLLCFGYECRAKQWARKMSVKPIPEGHEGTLFLAVRNAGDAITFYKNAFGAAETL
jgi:hypothetical protein